MARGRRGQLKCDGTCAETRFCLSAKRKSLFKSARASVQSTTGSRGVRISGSNAGYTMFWGSVKGTGYTLHSPVSPSIPLPCVTVCHNISTGVYNNFNRSKWLEFILTQLIIGLKGKRFIICADIRLSTSQVTSNDYDLQWWVGKDLKRGNCGLFKVVILEPRWGGGTK